MPIIDAHVHLYPPEVTHDPSTWIWEHSETHWATMCTRMRKDGRLVQFFPSVGELLRDMDKAGIERSILLGWYWTHPETCLWQNRFYAKCIRAHPDRLSAFATVNPVAGNAALQEIHWAHGEGLIGLGELSPHSQQVALTNPVWRKIVALAGELKLPINLHVTDPQSGPYPGRVETPLSDFVSLAREFPETEFILAHWGGGLAFNSENRLLRNVYFDSAASPLMYGLEVWRMAINAMGADRILFGSDNPLRLYPRTDAGTGLGAFVQEAKTAVSAKELDLVLSGNTARLLNLR